MKKWKGFGYHLSITDDEGDNCAQLYRRGHTIAEIMTATSHSRHEVVKALRAREVTMRTNAKVHRVARVHMTGAVTLTNGEFIPGFPGRWHVGDPFLQQ